MHDLIRDAVLIAGPTASGKSALALDIARREGRAIVNADSMQVYDVLRILTARPSGSDLSEAPHFLYGHVPPGTANSVGSWLEEVKRIALTDAFEAAPPIFVGGTGLYFRTLCQGLADIPAVPEEVREKWRHRLVAEGPAALHSQLSERDLKAAALIRAGDGQRIVRALEVHESTGKSIVAWQAKSGVPLIDANSATKIVLDADRSILNGRIERRFEAMMVAGALEEVRRIKTLDLPPEIPAMKAIGVPQLARFLDGEITIDDAVRQAKAASRQYAKRQATWFRHQLGKDWQRRPVS